MEQKQLFNELKEETSKLLVLLHDPQPGYVTWWGFLQERLDRLHQLHNEVPGT